MSDYQRLRELRKNIFDLSQGDFGEKIGISRDNVSKIETGRTKISAEIMVKLILTYKINPFYLQGISKSSVIEDEILDKLISKEAKNDLTMLNINVSESVNTNVQGNLVNDTNNSMNFMQEIIENKDVIIDTKDAIIRHLEERINDLKDLTKELKKSRRNTLT